MKYFVSFLLLVAISVVKSNPVEIEEDIDVLAAAAIPTTVIHASTLPTDAELQLLSAIERVHGSYLTNLQTAQSLSDAFIYRAPYCGWNVVIFPATNVMPPTDAMGAIWAGVPRSGYSLVLVTSDVAGVSKSMYYYVFSSPLQSRRCEF